MDLSNNSFSSKQLIQQINDLKEDLYSYYEKIETNKKLIKYTEYKLFQTCEHKWVRDPYANFDDNIKQVCANCKLYNCSYLYQIAE